jgi:hypothetical protein
LNRKKNGLVLITENDIITRNITDKILQMTVAGNHEIKTNVAKG